RRMIMILDKAYLYLGPALGSIVAGCYYNDAGLPPPGDGLYYPTGLVVSPGRSALYVANSDFDLQYNGGTVQAIDLNGVRVMLGNLLRGIRCSESIDSACPCPAGQSGCTPWPSPTPQIPNPVPLSQVCNGIPASLGQLQNGAGCFEAGDCA